MRILTRSLVLLAALALAAGARDSAAQFLRVPPAAPGADFPPLKVTLLNLQAPDHSVVRNLRSLADGQTSVLYYWIPENKRSESVLAEVQFLAQDLPGLRVFAVSALTPGVTREKVVERAKALQVKFPLIIDDGFQVAQALQIATVPSFAVIDRKGVLRLRGGASLLQPVRGKTTLADYIREGAASGKLATIEKLDMYHPALENVGKRFVEFKLPPFPAGRDVTLSDLVQPGKITTVFFWSPTCPHCKEALPTLAKARAKYRDKMNFVSVTQLPTPEMRQACTDVIRAFGIDFPILVDDGGEISGAYKVVSTPTTVVIQPGGTVSGCYFSGETDYVQILGDEIGKIGRP